MAFLRSKVKKVPVHWSIQNGQEYKPLAMLPWKTQMKWSEDTDPALLHPQEKKMCRSVFEGQDKPFKLLLQVQSRRLFLLFFFFLLQFPFEAVFYLRISIQSRSCAWLSSSPHQHGDLCCISHWWKSSCCLQAYSLLWSQDPVRFSHPVLNSTWRKWIIWAPSHPPPPFALQASE